MQLQKYFKYTDEGCEGEGYYMKVVDVIDCSSLKNEEELPYDSDHCIVIDVAHDEVIALTKRWWLKSKGYRETQQEALDVFLDRIKKEIKEDKASLSEKRRYLKEAQENPNWTCPYCAYHGCEHCIGDGNG